MANFPFSSLLGLSQWAGGLVSSGGVSQAAAFVACKVLNHLLAQQRFSADRLAQHAGKVVQFEVSPWVIALRVDAQGFVEEQAARCTSNACIAMDWAEVLGAIKAPAAAGKKARISGDIDFAQTLAAVLGTLRWDAEQDWRVSWATSRPYGLLR